MGKFGQRPGSALHRNWKQHTKIVRYSDVAYEVYKARYDYLKEVRALYNQYRELQEQYIRERVDKIKAKKQRKLENEQKYGRIVISDKRVKKMSKKQIRSMGIHKE